jgi:hypothetical protein
MRPCFISAFPSATLAVATVRDVAGWPLAARSAGGFVKVLSRSVIG